MKKLQVSIGIAAYNEEKNIGRLLSFLIGEDLGPKFELGEILVVSSGSTDETDQIVARFAKKDKRVKLLKQAKREGKASATNWLLAASTGDIIVLPSADILPFSGAIGKLVTPFLKKEVGMTGAHPIALKIPFNLASSLSCLMWRLHHLIALESHKCGEMLAIKNRGNIRIPSSIINEDAFLEYKTSQLGLKIVYAPTAKIYNQSPSTLKDFFKVRCRIAQGYFQLRQYGYKPTTWSLAKTFYLAVFKLRPSFDEILLIPLLGIFEFWSRSVAWLNYLLGKTNPIWPVAASTKELNLKEK